jgi:hypothetical protein
MRFSKWHKIINYYGMKKFAPGVAPVRGVVLLSPGQFIVTGGKIVIDYNLCDACVFV